MKKECKTCGHCDDSGEFGMMAVCFHPLNKEGGCANMEWAMEECLEKRKRYWKPKPKKEEPKPEPLVVMPKKQKKPDLIDLWIKKVTKGRKIKPRKPIQGKWTRT